MDDGLVLLLVGAVLARACSWRSARRGPAFRFSSRSSRSGCCSARTARAGSTSTTPSWRETVGIVGLVLILFEGGLQTSWRRLRHVAVPAALLSTVGVVVTALLTGVAAHLLFDLTWLEAILLGAVVASTDAAAVFATLRFTHVRRRLARTLEAESGGNDPMAIALTIGLIAWIESPTVTASTTSSSSSCVSSESASLVGVVLGSRRRGSSRASRARSGPFAPVASVAAAGCRSVSRTYSAAAASSRSTSSGSPSAARRRATGASSSASTRVSPSSPRSRLFIVLGLLVFPTT